MLYTSLRSFHAVAREGGFSAAAKALNVGQPTISEQVKTLEARYGVELFYRRGRKVVLSKAGQHLLEITRAMMGHETEAVRFLSGLKKSETGELNVGAASPFIMMKPLRLFQSRYPNIPTGASVDFPDRLIENLLDFEIDVAFLGAPVDDTRFVSARYHSFPLVLMVHAGHRLSGRRSVDVRALDGERIVMREKGSTTRLALETEIDAAGVTVETAMEINSREAIRDSVIEGLGVAVVSTLEFLPHERLKAIPFEEKSLAIHFHVACLASRRERPLISGFWDILMDEVGASPS